jgi:hypothetical protein
MVIAACAAAPETSAPPAGRDIAGDPATARERVAQELRALGFAVRENDAMPVLRAELAGSDPAWAECPLVLARDPDPEAVRASFERPEGVRTVVVARLTTLAARTHLSLDVLQVARYRNPYVNLLFEERCRSTGILETRLLDAAERR